MNIRVRGLFSGKAATFVVLNPGYNMAKARAAHGLSQEQLATQAGVNPEDIARIEKTFDVKNDHGLILKVLAILKTSAREICFKDGS